MNILWSTALVVASAVIAFLVLAWFSGGQKRRAASAHAQFTAKDVETALFAVLNPGYHGTFDEFLAWPINDPYLESIRQECLRIDQEFPPTRGNDLSEDGEKRIAALLRDLRQRTRLAGGSAGSLSDAL